MLKKLSGATDALVSDLDPASSKVVQDGQKKAVDRYAVATDIFPMISIIVFIYIISRVCIAKEYFSRLCWPGYTNKVFNLESIALWFAA